jgi:tol-pal system protein YbgF
MLLQKFFIYLCLCGALTVSAEPLESIEPAELSAQEDVLQLRQQLDQLRDVLLDQEDRISQQQKEIQKLRGDNEVLVHKIDQVQKQQQDIFLDMDKRLQALQTPAPPAVESTVAAPPDVKDVKTTVGTTPSTAVTDTVSGKAAKNPNPTTAAKPLDSALAKELIPPTAAKEVTEVKKEIVTENKPAEESIPAATTTIPLETAPKYSESAETEEQHYQKLMKWVDEGNEQQAVIGFEEFLQRYPQSKNADSAQYWLGESYYAVKNYSGAIKAFNTLLMNHPQSPKYSHALLKIGFSHYELKEFVRARELLQRVRSDYQGTVAARLAEQRLKKMTVEGH